MKLLRTDLIRQDGGTQMRVALNEDAIVGYAERMDAGDVFPPVTVFYDGAAYWLADGFHRIAARNRVAVGHAGAEPWSRVDADVRAGTRHDAIKFAIGANRTNGIRRTNADKQMAVRAALAHPDMQSMSDRAIADAVGVSHVMVHSARQVLTVNTSTPNSTNHKAVNTATDRRAKTIGVDGKKYPARQKSAPKALPKRSPGGERVNSGVEPSEPRASATPKHHVCPTCNGKGYIE